MSKVFRHKFANGNEVEIAVFEHDPTGENADILITCLDAPGKNQRYLCKIVPLEQTALLLELRNVVTKTAEEITRMAK